VFAQFARLLAAVDHNFTRHNKRAMTTTCSYNFVGGIPKDGSFTSGLRSKNLVACSGKFATIEANDIVVNEDLKAKDIIDASNVLYYGADPTGVADSTAAFQSALAAGRCSVYVPFGTYLITDTLAIPAAVSMHGECSRGTILNFVNNSANFDGITMGVNTALTDIFLTYNGTNFTTTTMISILFSNVEVRNVHITSTDTQMAYGIALEGVASNALISDSTIHGVVNSIRFTAAYANVRIAQNFLNVGTAGTVIDTTNAGTQIVVMGNRLRSNGAGSTGINAVVAVTAIGNVYSVSTPLAGAGLLTSTLHESITTSNSFNTLGRVSIDGTPVLNNQIGGWTTTTGASAPARTLATGENTAAQLTNAFKQLLADLNTHGLLAVTITP